MISAPMGTPLAAVHRHRNVEYGVHERSPGDWEWTYYPKVGAGVKTQGSTKGSRDDAVAACKAAIDAWLGPRVDQTGRRHFRSK